MASSVVMHGVGLCDEYPSIRYREDWDSYGYDGVFEPGMTICVEVYCGEKGGRDRFVAMHVHRKVNTGFIHCVADRENFGRFVGCGIVPLAIEIAANGIGPQMPAARTIGIALMYFRLATAVEAVKETVGEIHSVWL